MDRNLDGIYFRVQRDEKWENACFSDLTQEEMENSYIRDMKFGVKIVVVQVNYITQNSL